MKYEVRVYGDPALRRKAEPVEAVDEGTRALARDMLSTMYAGNGVGLAAAQIGRREALCVIDVTARSEAGQQASPAPAPDVDMPLVMVNPRIIESIGGERCLEGCLSFPEIFVEVTRAAKITVAFVDLEGRTDTLQAEGLLARAIQHELDHLEGVLLVDRMSPVQRVAHAGRLKRLKRQGTEAATR